MHAKVDKTKATGLAAGTQYILRAYAASGRGIDHFENGENAEQRLANLTCLLLG